MSGNLPPGGGILTILAIGLRGFLDRREILKLGKAEKRMREQAAREARAAERAAGERLRQWREEAERQMFDGTAGFASEAEARAAVNARGGRKSPLDGRKF